LSSKEKGQHRRSCLHHPGFFTALEERPVFVTGLKSFLAASLAAAAVVRLEQRIEKLEATIDARRDARRRNPLRSRHRDLEEWSDPDRDDTLRPPSQAGELPC
jgi:hypothetical protein